jgi:hypothetical protein
MEEPIITIVKPLFLPLNLELTMSLIHILAGLLVFFDASKFLIVGLLYCFPKHEQFPLIAKIKIR